MKKTYLKKLLFLLIAIVFCGQTYGQFLLESFDGTTYPPTGWTETVITNANTPPLTGLWERVTAGTNPTCTPHSGAGMLKYNTWDYVAATSGLLISPVVDLTAATPTTILEFWMYRDNGNTSAIDSLSFYINTTASITGATFLGNYNRVKSLSPVETGPDGWYKYQVLIPAGFNTATNYLILKGYSGYGNNLFVDDIAIKTPVAADAAPVLMTFSGTTVNSTTVGWSDNSTNENGFNVYMSTNATTGFVKMGATVPSTTTLAVGTTYSKAITGLLDNTTYYFKVTAVTDIESASLDGNTTTVAGTLSGIKTIGTTGDYPSLTAAFAAINANGLLSSVDLVLQADYLPTVETYPLIPSIIATAAKTIRVYPGFTGLSITSDSSSTLNLSGSNYVTFDGRVNATGNTVDLLIANTNLTGTAIYLNNDASHNKIYYCSVKGVNNTAPTVAKSGIIVFGNGISTGNDYNTISNCNITSGATTATNAINSNLWAGTATGLINEYNTIDSCNIYDFFNGAQDCYGIGTGIDNSYWTIRYNKIYQTAPRVFTVAAKTYYGISFNGAADGNLIQGNIIGYASNTQTGFTTISGSTNLIKGMRIWAGVTVPTSIQGNIIAGINQTSSRNSTTTNSAQFIGVRIAQGLFDMGSIEKNTIGSMTTNGSIILNATSITASTVPCLGILVQTSSQGTIANNEIGGITLSKNVTGTKVGFTAIANEAPWTINIVNNVIGGSVANSINVDPINGQLCGITVSATAKVTNIVNNTIKNLTNLGDNPGVAAAASVIGIRNLSANAGQLISGNSIHTLANTSTTAVTTVTGIYYAGPTLGVNNVEKNKIYNLSLATAVTTQAPAAIYGIYAAKGFTTYKNNWITLGNDVTAVGYPITAIYDSLGSNNFYHNTVYVGGANVVSAGNTFAFRSVDLVNARNVFNNIFINARSNASGSGVNYGVAVAGTAPSPANLLMDNNIIQATGTGSMFGYFNSLDVSNFVNWKTNTGLDANSLDVNPLIVNPTLAIPDLHLTIGSPAESAGTVIASVIDDIDGDVRANNTPSDIGADAGVYDILLPIATTFVPANASINVATATTVEVTFNEMVRKIDNTYLDNTNIASVITFVKVSDNSNVAFTATWDAATKKIVATPTVALTGGTTYKFSVSGLEDYSNNLLTGQDSTRFTTIASTDASLSDLTVNATTVAGFASTTYVYNVILPSGTTTVPTIVATPTDANATIVYVHPTALPGVDSVKVTAQDGTTQLLYVINYTVAAANDATLSDLKVNGTTVTGFAATTFSYNVVLPYGTVTVPTVLGIASDANATVSYVHAVALPGVDSVTVTAQDGITKLLYLVNFTITPAATDASLSDLQVSGTTVTGFAPTIYSYNVVLPAGTTAVPPVTAVATDANATIAYVHAAALPGVDSVKVTAQDGTTQLLYLVNFTVAVQTYTVTFNVIGTNGTLAATVDAASITSPATVNAGKNVIFTATPDANYSVKEWKLDGTIVSGNTSNTYTLSNLAANSTVTVEFKLNVGVNEAAQNVVSIYPNPANNVVNVKMDNIIYKIAVVNMNGQVVAESVINNMEGSINTSSIANGMYFLRIETANGITMNKIQIVK